MSFTEKGESIEIELEDAESHIQTFTLPNMSNTDLTSFTQQLSQDLSLDQSSEEMDNAMDMDTTETEVLVESHEDLVHEEVVHTEIHTQETDTEDVNMTCGDQTVPEIKPVVVPTLKPLTILPKPAKQQVPIAVKPMAGQQLLLVQGGTSGQAIKLLNPQGQELNLTALSGRPLNTVTLKSAAKTITSQGGNVSLVSQQKPVVMKKIITAGPRPTLAGKPVVITSKPGQQIMLIQRPNEPVKLVPTSGNITALQNSTPKTITLQQAQEMGLITNATTAKVVTANQVGKQAVIINKLPQQKTIKLVPHSTAGQLLGSNHQSKTITLSQIKSPTKILPASAIQGAKPGQRIIFKSASGAQTILPAGQLIQVSGAQTGGQIHQINIPGKGPQLIKFVTSNAGSTTGHPVTVNAIRTTSSLQPTLITTSKIAPKPIAVKQIALNKATGAPQIVVVPNPNAGKVPIPAIRKPPPPPVPKPVLPTVSSSESSGSSSSTTEASSNTENSEANGGIRPRKPCNCTKSQCLKLYCDCFANGEFCYLCNCVNCSNNLENEEYRNRAIKACLERNPSAFRPKIGKAKDTMGDVLRKHTKGCNCKRSGCLKNYCECYEAKIACSSNCKCIGCRNIEDCMEKKIMMELDPKSERDEHHQERLLRGILPAPLNHDVVPTRGRRSSNNRKQTINYITDDVIEATCQCMLTISDNADSAMQDEETTKRQILEEFGRCLTEIISVTNKSFS